MGILEIFDSKRDTHRTEINLDHYDLSIILGEVEALGFNFYFCSTPSGENRQKHMVIMSGINDNFGMVDMCGIVSETFISAFKGF